MTYFININNNLIYPYFLNSHLIDGSEKRKNQIHSHPVFHVILIERGGGQALFGKTYRQIKAGDLLLVSPEVRHQFISDASSPYVFSQFTFEMRDSQDHPVIFSFSQLLNGLGYKSISDVINLDSNSYRVLRSRIHAFLPFGNLHPESAQDKRKSEIMIIEFLQLLGKRQGPAGAMAQDTEPYLDPVDLATKFLHAHYSEKLTLGRIANAASISPSHLSRIFKSRKRTGLFQFLLEIRLNAALNLLRNSHFSIREIAEKAGFSDIFYFSRCFKKKFRKSPRQYREIPLP